MNGYIIRNIELQPNETGVVRASQRPCRIQITLYILKPFILSKKIEFSCCYANIVYFGVSLIFIELNGNLACNSSPAVALAWTGPPYFLVLL